MTRQLLPVELHHTERQLRLIAVLDACKAAGLSPASVTTVHTVAYLSDALAPVWDLPILDGQFLKRRRALFFPSLQRDLDRLVAHGVVCVSRVRYVQNDDGSGWSLDARYTLDSEFSERILKAARSYSRQARKLQFVREVVYAAAGLGAAGIESLGTLDAAYSNPLIDVGGVIDIDTNAESGEPNATAEIAFRFGQLTDDSHELTDAELIHLYVRHLYARMRVA